MTRPKVSKERTILGSMLTRAEKRRHAALWEAGVRRQAEEIIAAGPAGRALDRTDGLSRALAFLLRPLPDCSPLPEQQARGAAVDLVMARTARQQAIERIG